jgi:predicted AAA+ superfamily ATPase
LTGSHQPALQAAITQSLAGRTALLELLPLSIEEIASTTSLLERDNLLYTGFMPRAYNSQIQPQRLYADYFKTYVERDIRQLANLKNLNLFETFVRLLAGRIGQVLNLNSLATDVGVSSTTIKEWLSLLETSYIITILHPYYRNFGKRFIKAPKVYFVETGLVAYLLGIRSEKQIATHPLVGNLFENMVVMDLLKQRLNQGLAPDMYYMRTSNGVEIDVVQENEGKLDLYEIKSGATFNKEMGKNLLALQATIGSEVGCQTVIYAGHVASLAEGIQYKNFKDVH